MLYVVIWIWSQAEGVNLSNEPPSGLGAQAPQAYPADAIDEPSPLLDVTVGEHPRQAEIVETLNRP
jgi:hypothetical protein